jgi:hypothetical protein
VRVRACEETWWWWWCVVCVCGGGGGGGKASNNKQKKNNLRERERESYIHTLVNGVNALTDLASDIMRQTAAATNT